MGEVYRARDATLNRDVAIKVLPDAFVADRDRLARFAREAQTLAALNHPNVAHIYGVIDAAPETPRAIVMELVEGDGLDQRLARGRLTLRDTVAIARQIADGVAAAHDAGIVHRDLKPANIRIRTDGTVKVLDFGLAKARDVAAGSGSHNAATVSGTEVGVILGTTGYMSPEQARGSVVDKRTDVWAFGCVLYEMLTGRRAFAGATVTDTIGKILEREPDWDALPADAPPGLIRLLRRCLEKDPRRRLRDLGDASIELDDTASGAHATVQNPRRGSFAVVAGLLLLAALGWATAGWLWRRGPAPTSTASTPVVQFELEPAVPVTFNVSANGRTVAWVAPGADDVNRIHVRPIDSSDAKELRGTEGATLPILRPTGDAVAFYAGGQLKRIDIATGTIRVLTDTPGVSLGATWSKDDVILFSNRFGLQAIPAAGGEVREVVSLDRGRQENSLRFPQFLPDGRHFVYVARSGRTDKSAAYLGSLHAKPKLLFTTLSKVMYAPPGHLLFLRGGTLVAQKFDLANARVEGDEKAIATNVAGNPLGLNAGFTVSETGVLVYARAMPRSTTTLEWFNRAGKPLGAFGEPGSYPQMRIAPDGRRVVVALTDEQSATRGVWILAAGQTPARVTPHGTNDWFPFWSHDGSRIAFGSYRDGPLDIYTTTVAEPGRDTPLVQSTHQKDPLDWSPDGRYLLYRDTQRNLRGDLVVVDVATKQITELPRTENEERSGRFSRDGRWIAYVSHETGRPEVWVQPFPATGARWQVSVNGADEPTWGGTDLFYIDRAGMLVARSVLANGKGFASGPERPLFKVGSPLANGGSQRYDSSGDGTRFLVAVGSSELPMSRGVVVLNWPLAALR